MHRKSGLMGLVFITERKKKEKGSSSHMRATFLNMQLCYHRRHEERWGEQRSVQREKTRLRGENERLNANLINFLC